VKVIRYERKQSVMGAVSRGVSHIFGGCFESIPCPGGTAVLLDATERGSFIGVRMLWEDT
jgi:hypothetical protein